MQVINDVSERQQLLRLNDDYIDSVKTSNVDRFREILADDFLCSLPDGRLLDRAQFLEHTARSGGLEALDTEDVKLRIMGDGGDIAIVHARTTFTQRDGTKGTGRYTDVWARRNGQWLAVSAHVTRLGAR
jgi:hypothetical protein